MTDMHDEGATIGWYRTPIPRPVLTRLNARSDIKGFLRCCGILGLLACTGTATLWSAFSGHWIYTPFLLLLHGTVGSFNINAVHELCHNTVFKTKWLNGLFVRIFGFIGWSDWVWFNTSHANHHRYTLHPPRDGEVVLPILWTRGVVTRLEGGILVSLYVLYLAEQVLSETLTTAQDEFRFVVLVVVLPLVLVFLVWQMLRWRRDRFA